MDQERLPTTDNQCLSIGSLDCEELLPLYCLENAKVSSGDFSSFHLLAQWQALRSLEQALSSRGSGLRFCHGSVIEQFEELIKSYRFDVLYSHQETGNLLSYETDLAVANWCSHHGIRWVECNASSVQRGGNAASKRKKRGTSDPRMTSPIGDPVLLKSPENKHFSKAYQASMSLVSWEYPRLPSPCGSSAKKSTSDLPFRL